MSPRPFLANDTLLGKDGNDRINDPAIRIPTQIPYAA
jgi:hypothetical protein